MTDATPGNRRIVGRPLFLRIFALLLGSLIAVQAMNAILVIFTPPPAPRIFSLDQIEHALRGGESETFKRSEQSDPGVEQGSAPRERHVRDLLAARLNVGPDAIRVSLRRPLGPRRFLGPRPISQDAGALEGVVGQFTIALRQSGTQWVAVSPAGLDIAFWRWRAIATLLFALLVAAPIAWWLSRRVARPIAMFGAAAERLGRDPNSPPIELSGPPEVAEAAFAFNEMQAKLQSYVANRSLMLGAVAHDLRTPLMRIALHLEHAPKPVRSAVQGEVAEMQAMLAAVLAFLRDQEQPARRQSLNLRAITESVADELADEGHQIELAEGPPIVVEGNRSALKSLVSNLMRNAVNHAEGPFRVVLGANASVVWLEIRDHGSGIPEEMLERMFEPFVRGEVSRSRETGGIGLGLASARAVARGHGGDVTLANRPDGGLTARVELAR